MRYEKNWFKGTEFHVTHDYYDFKPQTSTIDTIQTTTRCAIISPLLSCIFEVLCFSIQVTFPFDIRQCTISWWMRAPRQKPDKRLTKGWDLFLIVGVLFEITQKLARTRSNPPTCSPSARNRRKTCTNQQQNIRHNLGIQRGKGQQLAGTIKPSVTI